MGPQFLMNTPTSETRRKISKAVYLLLEKYHCKFGLSVVAWWKTPGNEYFSFFCMPIRDRGGSLKHLPEVNGQFSLTIYQDHVSIPSWSNESPSRLDIDPGELRTAQLLEWYEENLSFHELFNYYRPEINEWRKRYHVEESEAYLFSWNLMGLFSTRIDEVVRCDGCNDWGPSEFEKESLRILGSQRTQGEVFFCGEWSFTTDGKALQKGNSEVLELWKDHLDGTPVNEIAERLIKIKK